MEVASLLRRLKDYRTALEGNAGKPLDDFQAADLQRLVERSEKVASRFLAAAGGAVVATPTMQVKDWSQVFRLLAEIVRALSSYVQLLNDEKERANKQRKAQKKAKDQEEKEEKEEEEEKKHDALLPAATALALSASAFAAYQAGQSLGQARQANAEGEMAYDLLTGSNEMGINGDLSNVTATNTGRLISSDAETAIYELSSQGVQLSTDLRNTPTKVFQLTADMDDALEQVSLAYQVIADRHADDFFLTSAFSVGSAVCAAQLFFFGYGYRSRPVKASALSTVVVSGFLYLYKTSKEAQRAFQVDEAKQAAERLLSSLAMHRANSANVSSDLVQSVQKLRAAKKHARAEAAKPKERANLKTPSLCM